MRAEYSKALWFGAASTIVIGICTCAGLFGMRLQSTSKPLSMESSPDPQGSIVVPAPQPPTTQFTPRQKEQATQDIEVAFASYVPRAHIAECFGYVEGEWKPNLSCPQLGPLNAFIEQRAQDVQLMSDMRADTFELDLDMNVTGYADGKPVSAHYAPVIEDNFANSQLSPGMTADNANQKLACLRAISMRDVILARLKNLLGGRYARINIPTGQCIVVPQLGGEYRGVVVKLTATMRKVPLEDAPIIRERAKQSLYDVQIVTASTASAPIGLTQ